MKERIRQIRKIKHLSQTEFGSALGVSRDVISNYEMGRVEPTELFINHLCSTFNVNEEWLRTGNGEIFAVTPKTILDELSQAYELNNNEKAIIESFLELSPEGRSAIVTYIQNIAKKL